MFQHKLYPHSKPPLLRPEKDKSSFPGKSRKKGPTQIFGGISGEKGPQTGMPAHSSLGRLHLPNFKRCSWGRSSSTRVSTPPVSQARPSGVAIRMGCPQATQKTFCVRGVGSNHDPGTLPDLQASLFPLQGWRPDLVLCRPALGSALGSWPSWLLRGLASPMATWHGLLLACVGGPPPKATWTHQSPLLRCPCLGARPAPWPFLCALLLNTAPGSAPTGEHCLWPSLAVFRGHHLPGEPPANAPRSGPPPSLVWHICSLGGPPPSGQLSVEA